MRRNLLLILLLWALFLFSLLACEISGSVVVTVVVPTGKTENLTHQYSSPPQAPAILPSNPAATPAAAQTTEEPLEPEHRAMQRVTVTLTAARQAMATDTDRPALRRLPRCHFCGCPCCEDPSILDLGGS